jgi:hypothetical protein
LITIPLTPPPDGIEQKLLGGQRLRSTHHLKQWHGIRLDAARIPVGLWLVDRRQAHDGRDEITGPKRPPTTE